MTKKVRTIILIIVFVGVLFAYRTAIAEHNLSCDDAYNIKVYARCMVSEKWNDSEWSAFDYIIQNESGWTHNKAHYANYPERSATGLAGFLDSTWATVDCERTYDKREQIDCGIKYIQTRYDTPSKAKQHHIRNNWY